MKTENPLTEEKLKEFRERGYNYTGVEEKQRLFNEKVSELKNLFEKESLGELKSLKFDIDETPRLEGTEESIS